MNLEGKIVKLRTVEREDLEVLKELRNEHLGDNIFRQYRPLTSGDQDGYWDHVINHENFIVFTICIPDIDTHEKEIAVHLDKTKHYFTRKGWRVVGECRVGYISWRNGWSELGIFLGKEFMSHGYGREALYLLMEYAFANLGLHAIRAETVTPKVKELFEEFGFHFIGQTEGTTYHDNEWRPDYILELYSSRWFQDREAIYKQAVEPHLDRAEVAIKDTIK